MRTEQQATNPGRPRPLGESHVVQGASFGEVDGSVLAGWLNAAKETASYRRVINILNLIGQTEASTKEALAHGAYTHVFKRGAPRKWPKEKQQLQRAAAEIQTGLDRALRKYLFHVRLTKPLFDRWLFNIYCPKQRNDFCWETNLCPKAPEGQTVIQASTYRVFEGDAVMAAVRLSERGLLNRIRLCTTCSQRWFFAKHSNYKFCSPTCRERYYMRTDEYREKKAIQMREYRARLLLRQEAEKRKAKLN